MISSPRLRLRQWNKADLPAAASILGDPNVMEFSDNGPLNAFDQSAWLDQVLAATSEPLLPGTLAIEIETSAHVIGYVSLKNDRTRVDAGEAELGFRLAKQFWGNGYATEATSRVLLAGTEMKMCRRVIAIVDPHNAPSVRVLKKIGMTFHREVMFDGYDHPDFVFVKDLEA